MYIVSSNIGELFKVFVLSMLPVIELRGAIPVGIAMGLPPWQAFIFSVLGNMVPVPLIILFTRQVFAWCKTHCKIIGRMVIKLENKAYSKSEVVLKYRKIGLCILVAIPLPGTGAWTGAIISALLNMPLRSAIPAILMGVIIAGIIVTCVSCGVVFIF